MPPLAEPLLRILRYRNPLRYSAGRERISIDDLISPLRYDILIRERYLSFLAELDPDPQDVGDLIHHPTTRPYYVWFRHIFVPRFLPGIVDREDEVREAFATKVRAALALHRSFESEGYDARYPIIVRTGRPVLPTASGKRLARQFYAGDGCHRLALLRRSGVTTLEPHMYRLLRTSDYAPPDHTFILLGPLHLTPPEYFAFLSLSYAPGETPRTKEALLDEVRRRNPDRADEVRAVIAADEPHLHAGDGGGGE